MKLLKTSLTLFVAIIAASCSAAFAAPLDPGIALGAHSKTQPIGTEGIEPAVLAEIKFAYVSESPGIEVEIYRIIFDRDQGEPLLISQSQATNNHPALLPYKSTNRHQHQLDCSRTKSEVGWV